MSEGLKLGELFQGKYVVEREVGRGSFGAVYRARLSGSRQPLAIKVLLPWMRDDAEMRHRFTREAKLASHLKCENAVQIVEYGETDEGDLFIVMEFLEGQPLDELLAEEGPLEPDRVVEITRQVLRSLAEAHALGIVHRDLKPPNIFLCRSNDGLDRVKVFDYGIAKIVGGDNPGSLKETTKLTIRGGLVGTPVYMSPEQCRGEQLTAASDLYSLGICIYEMLTGDVPFDHANPVQVMMMHNRHPIPDLPPGLAKTLAGRVMAKALQKDLTKRFANAAEFLAAIDDPSKLTNQSSTETKAETGYRDTVALQLSEEESSMMAGVDKQQFLNAEASRSVNETSGGIPATQPAGGIPGWAYALFGIFGLLIVALVVVIVLLLNKP